MTDNGGMTDHLKPDEVLVDINDQHAELFIREYVLVRVAYKLPKEAFGDVGELSPFVNAVVDAAQKAALDAYAQFRPEDYARWKADTP